MNINLNWIIIGFIIGFLFNWIIPYLCNKFDIQNKMIIIQNKLTKWIDKNNTL